ncbi:MAG: hypothetical protein AAB531_02340 [Patescibacteria group bacterium]
MKNNHPLIDYWPQFSFEDLDNLEIDDRFSKIVYESILFPLRIPEKTLGAFFNLLKTSP